ncbi:MAG: cobalamin-binding protein, partial [Pseudomonadota bacterium]
ELDKFSGRVEQVYLSSEPYAFRDKHVAEVQEIFRDGTKVSLVDGEMLSWYGSRAIQGLAYLEQLATRK